MFFIQFLLISFCWRHKANLLTNVTVFGTVFLSYICREVTRKQTCLIEPSSDVRTSRGFSNAAYATKFSATAAASVAIGCKRISKVIPVHFATKRLQVSLSLFYTNFSFFAVLTSISFYFWKKYYQY